MKRTCLTFRRRQHTGLTLTEVLIATFVMAIGLLSLASLIPVGLHEVAMASRAQHAASVGREAWRTIKIRGWTRPYGPPWPASPPSPQAAIWFNRQGTPTGLPANSSPGAFAIDPFFLSAYSNNGASAAFPINDANGAPVLPRITLRGSEYDFVTPITNPPKPLPLLAANRNYLYARRLFTDQNDLMFKPYEGAPRPGRVGLLAEDSSGNLVMGNPQVEGGYSWMMTVSPSLGDPNRLSIVSVVVFHKRQVENPDPSGGNPPLPDPTQERTAVVTFPPFGSPGSGPYLGGGDIQLNWKGAVDAFPKVRPGNWLMLFGRITNGPIFARWYRVVATDDNEGLANQRFMTVQGYDWPSRTMIPKTYAAVFPGVVGVYEKTIQLE